MDSKQFDELIARLATAASRRSAVKGAVGGALASVGVTSVDSLAKKGKGKGKGKGKNKNKKCKGGTKVTICHKGSTLSVSQCALKGHLKHGDTEGPCPYGT